MDADNVTVHDEYMRRIADQLNTRPSYVVLGQRADGVYVGVTENSFSMGVSDKYVRVWWSSKNATSNFGGTGIIVNGEEDAEYQRQRSSKNHPELKFMVYDLHSPDCPIDIDWGRYLWSHTPAPKKLSGIRDKYGARNPDFHARGEFCGAAAQPPEPEPTMEDLERAAEDAQGAAENAADRRQDR